MGTSRNGRFRLMVYIIGGVMALPIVIAWLGVALEAPTRGIVLNAILGIACILVLYPKTRTLILQRFGRKSPSRVSRFVYLLLGVSVLGLVLAISSFDNGQSLETEPMQSKSVPVSEPQREPAHSIPPPSLPEVPPLEQGVVLDIEVLGLDKQKPNIGGLTNLPNGTDLMVTVENRLGYSGQQTVKVKDRRFSAGPFSQNGDPLPIARYVVDVVMPIPSVQSEDVRTVIGEKGEKLQGDLVEKDDIGVTVKKIKEFFIGNTKKAAISAERAELIRTNKAAKQIYRRLRSLLKNGKGMARLRESHELPVLERCGELMRKYQAEADNVWKEVQLLPHKKYGFLQIAANPGNVIPCVSCARGTAPALSCQRLEEWLKKAKGEIR